MKSIAAYAAILVAAVATAAGCTRRDLTQRPEGAPVRIILDWKENRPPTATGFVFYNIAGGNPLYYSSDNRGFEGTLPAGTYSVEIFNTDASGVRAEYGLGHGTDFFHALETTRAVPKIIGNVGNVFGTGIDLLVVPKSHIGVEQTAVPTDYVRRVDFTIDPRNVSNIDHITVSLSGIVYSVRIATGQQTHAETATVRESAIYDSGTLRYRAAVGVLGFSGTNDVWVKVYYTDGVQEIASPKDITQDIADAGDEGININLELQLEKGGEIGLTVEVAPWDGSGTGSGIVD